MGDTRDISRRGFLGGTVAVSAAVAMPTAAEAVDAPAPPDGLSAASMVVDEPSGDHELHTTVNGVSHSQQVGVDTSVVALLRGQLGLTGTKQVCGTGACGACTCLLDDEPVSSCLLPAVQLEGRRLTTVEGIGGPGLHPIQRAFMAEDALQCGFCTPGFVVAASAFHDRWRAAEGVAEPSREQVAAALSGHLCRCGAYVAIFRAVQAACRGEHDLEDPIPARPDAREKVMGTATYTVDLSLPGMLHGVVVRSPHASARVDAIDLTPALAVEGVRGGITLLTPGQRVHFAGQALAAIAADTAEIARAAVALVGVEYFVLPVISSLEMALEAGAAEVFPTPGRDKPALGNEFALPGGHWEGNLRGPFRASFGLKPGRARAALDQQEQGVRATYRIATQLHTAFEPHAAIAHWVEGGLEIYTSTQACSDLGPDLARHFKLRREAVRVRCDYVGGAFGAKATAQLEHRVAGELARQTGAPVRVVFSRAEEMQVGGQRPGSKVQLALVAGPEGELGGLRTLALNDGGASVGASITFVQRMLYHSPRKSLQDFDVLTHTPPAKPFRGPGGPQALWSLEQAVDELAIMRGEDPLALRLRWERHAVRQMLLEWAAALPAWRERAASGERVRRGVGVALAAWPYLLTPPSQVEIEASRDGFTVSTACQDMGNGPRGVLAEAVARVLKLPAHTVTVRIGDSALPYGPTSGGSRTTTSIGPAAEDAARQCLVALLDRAAERGLTQIRPALGGVDHAGGHLPWSALLEGPSLRFVGRRRPDKGGYYTPVTFEKLRVGRGQGSSLAICEVSVDTATGAVRAERVWVGVGCGRIYHLTGARSQVEGAVMQGVSYALHEERRVDLRTARQLSIDLDHYSLLRLGQAPEVSVHFEERGFEHVTGGGIGLSEVAGLPVAAAVGNAVRHATGVRFTDLPLTAARVLGGLT